MNLLTKLTRKSTGNGQVMKRIGYILAGAPLALPELPESWITALYYIIVAVLIYKGHIDNPDDVLKDAHNCIIEENREADKPFKKLLNRIL